MVYMCNSNYLFIHIYFKVEFLIDYCNIGTIITSKLREIGIIILLRFKVEASYSHNFIVMVLMMKLIHRFVD